MSEGSAKAPKKDPEKGTERPRKFQGIKGTRDILPPETALWNRVEQTAHEVFATYGFGEIRLPIFEPTELFARSIGVETDVVSKEMYSFEDRDETSVALRPEATASVCRAYIEHGMHTWPSPVKLYYMGPMFRRERPQKGRYRQFYQIGAEVLTPAKSGQGGAEDAAIDAEVIEMVMIFFAKVGLDDTRLYVNSIGCKECRPKYVAALRAELQRVRDELGPDSQRRIETNPLRVLDSKLESEQAIIEKLPRISAHLCAECAKNYEQVKRELKLRGITFEENWRLVRGLDYYMRTTFEITAPGLGSQNAVCGGGRYDGLVELLGGPPTKGIGFAIGEDRLILSLQESIKNRGEPARHCEQGSFAERGRLDVFVAWMGETAYKTAIRAARALRHTGFAVELPGTAQKFSKALSAADKLGARYALILGEDEMASGQWTLKSLADGQQIKLAEADLLTHLKQNQSLSS